jgi:hypothetical protein
LTSMWSEREREREREGNGTARYLKILANGIETKEHG